MFSTAKTAAPGVALALVLTLGSALPSHAQGQQYQSTAAQDKLRADATTLTAERSRLYAAKDPKAVASVFTTDALYVSVLPTLEILKGRAAIQKHFDELVAARAAIEAPQVTSADMIDRDRMVVGGDYVIVSKRKRIDAHFFEILRREDGKWKVAVHVYGRPEAVTAAEVASFHGN